MTCLQSHKFPHYIGRNFSNYVGKKMFFKEENKFINYEIWDIEEKKIYRFNKTIL